VGQRWLNQIFSSAKIAHKEIKLCRQKITKKTLQIDLSFKNIDLFGLVNSSSNTIEKAIENSKKKRLILCAKSKKVRVLFRSLLLLRAGLSRVSK
jgi:hypothetical protein